MRQFLLSLFILCFGSQIAGAQTFEIIATPRLGGGDSLLLDISLRTTSSSLLLGASNISLRLDSTLVDPPNVQLLPGTLGDPQGFNTSARDASYLGLTATGASNRINVTIAAGGADLTEAFSVTTTATRIATVYVPIIRCGSSLSVLDGFPTPSLIGEYINPNDYDYPGDTLLPGLPFFLGSPAIVGVPSPVIICTSGATNSYSSGGGPGYWRLSSNSGSLIVTNPNNTSSVTVNFGTPAGTQVDTLFFATEPDGVCATELPITIIGPPNASFPLGVAGPSTICTSNPTTNILIRGSEAGITYRLKQNGTVVDTAGGTGSTLVFGVTLPSVADTISFTYEAVRGGCIIQSQSAPQQIIVDTCFTTPEIAGNDTLTVCANQTLTVSVESPRAGSTYTWTAITTPGPQVITFPNSSLGTSVNIDIAQVTSNRTARVILTETRADSSGKDTLLLTVTPGANPQITGPGFVYFDTAFSTVAAQFQVTSPDTSKTYEWSVIPLVFYDTTGGNGQILDVVFGDTLLPRVYTIRLRETINATGCVAIIDHRVLVSGCDANPGTASSDQVICQGEQTALAVGDDYDVTSSIWQVSLPGESTFSDVTTGVGRTGQLYFTAPLLTVGTYRFRLAAIGPGPCTNYSRVISVQVVPEPLPGVVTPTDTSVCENGQVTLRLNGGSGTILWQQSPDGIFWTEAIGTASNADTIRTGPLTTSTFYRALTYNDCNSVQSNAVFVSVEDLPQGLLTTTTLDSICVGDDTDPLIATIVAGDFGFWTSNGDGTFTTTGPIVYRSVAADAGKTITLNWVVTAGSCDPDINTVTVAVKPLPLGTASVTGSTSICAGNTVDGLTATIVSGTTGYWTDGDAQSGTFFPDSTSASVRYFSNVADAGKSFNLSWVTISAPCAPDTQSISVIVSNTVLTGDFPQPADICFEAGVPSAPLGATATGGAGRWTSDSPFGVFVPNDTASNARFLPTAGDAGNTVNVTWTVSNGSCPNFVLTKGLRIDRDAIADINPLADPNVCFDDAILISAQPTSFTGQWTAEYTDTGLPVAGSFSPNDFSNTVEYLPVPAEANREIRILWTKTNGTCDPAQDTVLIRVGGVASGGFSLGTDTLVCAGGNTAPLNAALGNSFYTGTWSAVVVGPSTISGTFSPSLDDPNALYNTVGADAGKKIRLIWTVESPGCATTATYEDTITVSTETVDGSFIVGGDTGPLTINQDSICGTAPSRLFTATTSGGPTVQGVFRKSSNAAGRFYNTITAIFDDSLSQNGLVYIPDTSDIGKAIVISYNISNSAAPTCIPLSISRTLYVRDTIGSTINTINDICIPGVSQFLVGKVVGDTTALAFWEVADINGVRLPNILQDFLPTTGGSTDSVQFEPDAALLGDTIILRYVVSNGVCSSVTKGDTVFVGGEDLINVVVSSTSICQGDTVTFTASGAETYVWSPDIRISSTTGPVVQAYPLTSRIYALSAFIGACRFDTTISITVTPGIDIVPSATPTTVCVSGFTTLNVTGGVDIAAANYEWTVLSGDASVFAPTGVNTTRNPTVSPNVSTKFKIRALTTNGCFAEDSINVIVDPAIPPFADSLEFCEVFDQDLSTGVGGIADTFQLTVPSGSCLDTYWYNGTLAELNAEPQPYDPAIWSSTNRILSDTITYPALRPYTVRCVTAFCETFKETFIEMLPAPLASFTTDTSEVPDYAATVNFRSTSDLLTTVNYSWDFGDTASGTANLATGRTVTHIYSGAGSYTVVLFIENRLGCTDFEVKNDTVTVTPTFYYFPTAFSPNEDNLNDIFRPVPNSLETPDYDPLGDPNSENFILRVFDRYGNLIFETFDPLTGWNGKTPDGKTYDIGTYSYFAQIQYIREGQNVVLPYRGVVALIK